MLINEHPQRFLVFFSPQWAPAFTAPQRFGVPFLNSKFGDKVSPSYHKVLQGIVSPGDRKTTGRPTARNSSLLTFPPGPAVYRSRGEVPSHYPRPRGIEEGGGGQPSWFFLLVLQSMAHVVACQPTTLQKLKKVMEDFANNFSPEKARSKARQRP